MKATELLKRQHREVKSLLKEAENSEDSSERRRLVDTISRKLQLHTQIEEEIFYPAVRASGTKKAEELVDEAFEEHHVVKLVLAEMPDIDVDDERFRAKITVLSELIEHHVEEEEETMFKIATTKLGDEELKELGEQMEAMMGEAEEEEETAPHRKRHVEAEPQPHR